MESRLSLLCVAIFLISMGALAAWRKLRALDHANDSDAQRIAHNRRMVRESTRG